MNADVNTFLGLGTLAGFLICIVVIVLQHRQKGDLIEALTNLAATANDNTKALDLIEPLATKVVPVSMVKGINQGIDLAETFTPDEIDTLLEQFRKLINKSTDNQPNGILETRPIPPEVMQEIAARQRTAPPPTPLSQQTSQ